MEADELTNEIVGKVNALKRKVEKERRLRAEADERSQNASTRSYGRGNSL